MYPPSANEIAACLTDSASPARKASIGRRPPRGRLRALNHCEIPRGVSVSSSSKAMSRTSRSRSANSGRIADVVRQLRIDRSFAPVAHASVFCVNPTFSSARTTAPASTARARSRISAVPTSCVIGTPCDRLPSRRCRIICRPNYRIDYRSNCRCQSPLSLRRARRRPQVSPTAPNCRDFLLSRRRMRLFQHDGVPVSAGSEWGLCCANWLPVPVLGLDASKMGVRDLRLKGGTSECDGTGVGQLESRIRDGEATDRTLEPGGPEGDRVDVHPSDTGLAISMVPVWLPLRKQALLTEDSGSRPRWPSRQEDRGRLLPWARSTRGRRE